MQLHVSAIALFVAGLPALAAPTCPAPQVVNGNNCTYTASLGWVVAGTGTASILTLYVPPNATGPIDFEVTDLHSTLGSSYSGYLGIKAGNLGGPKAPSVVTLSDIVAGGPASIGLLQPGELRQFVITQLCWDPTCTQPAPAGAAGAFSLQFSMSSPNPNDMSLTPAPRLTIQFLNGSEVTWQENETALRSNSPYNIIPGISLGTTEATRYVSNGSSGVTQPFDAFSISNLNNPKPLTGTVTLQDSQGKEVASTLIPPIQPDGAAGYLLIGRMPGDTIGLFPSSTVLPASSDGLFHGSLLVSLSGQSSTGQALVLVQEYNGNAMTNMPVYHSPVP